MIHDETVVVETKWFPFGKSEGEYKLDQIRIRTPEYDCEINIGQMKKWTQEFISKKKARPIELKNLHRYRVAWFEHGHLIDYPRESLSNVITGWKISGDTLIAVKVYRYKGEMKVEQRKYLLENYGKTWRCWSAVPTRKQRERTPWLND